MWLFVSYTVEREPIRLGPAPEPVGPALLLRVLRGNSGSIIIHPEIPPPGTRRQRRQRFHAGVGDELHVAVGEDEVGPALVQAPSFPCSHRFRFCLPNPRASG